MGVKWGTRGQTGPGVLSRPREFRQQRGRVSSVEVLPRYGRYYYCWEITNFKRKSAFWTQVLHKGEAHLRLETLPGLRPHRGRQTTPQRWPTVHTGARGSYNGPLWNTSNEDEALFVQVVGRKHANAPRRTPGAHGTTDTPGEEQHERKHT